MYILMHENHKFHKHPLHIRKSSNGKKLASGNLVQSPKIWLVRGLAKFVPAVV